MEQADGTDRWNKLMEPHGKPFRESEYGATNGAIWSYMEPLGKLLGKLLGELLGKLLGELLGKLLGKLLWESAY